MIMRKQLEEAPMWTIFTGEAADPGPISWGLFSFEPARPYPEDVLQKMRTLSVLQEEPEKNDEGQQPRANVDDTDAALMYLRNGGSLCKVPDTMASKYWRLLVVAPVVEDAISR